MEALNSKVEKLEKSFKSYSVIFIYYYHFVDMQM